VTQRPYYEDDHVTLHLGDALAVLREMPAASVDSVVTSPPYYGLRDYGHDDQWGAESSVHEYVERLRVLFVELRRVLVPTGAVWLNLGDTYAGKANASTAAGSFDRDRPARQIAQRNRLQDAPYKSLIGVPWRVALALQDDGWAVRNELVWAKSNPMPHPVADRLNAAHETVFLLTPRPRYYFDLDAVREPIRNPEVNAPRLLGNGRRNTFGRLVLTVTPPDGTVLDPFNGRGTTGRVARLNGRRYVGIDLNAGYLDLTVAGLAQGVLS